MKCSYNVTLSARSCNHWCSGKVMSITYSECVSVALGIQQAIRMRIIVICGLPHPRIFSHIISKGTIFERKFTEDIICVLVVFTPFV